MSAIVDALLDADGVDPRAVGRDDDRAAQERLRRGATARATCPNAASGPAVGPRGQAVAASSSRPSRGRPRERRGRRVPRRTARCRPGSAPRCRRRCPRRRRSARRRGTPLAVIRRTRSGCCRCVRTRATCRRRASAAHRAPARRSRRPGRHGREIRQDPPVKRTPEDVVVEGVWTLVGSRRRRPLVPLAGRRAPSPSVGPMTRGAVTTRRASSSPVVASGRSSRLTTLRVLRGRPRDPALPRPDARARSSRRSRSDRRR